MATSLLCYDILYVSCARCGNCVELSDADPRRLAEGYGFRFNGDSPQEDFTCLECNCRADDSYYDIAVHREDGEHELHDLTATIHAILGRSSG